MTDLISRDALIDTLYEHEFSSYIDKGAVSTLINDAPTVDAVPVRHGKWIDRNGAVVAPFWERYECSECGARSDNSKYCPHCGARMDEE